MLHEGVLRSRNADHFNRPIQPMHPLGLQPHFLHNDIEKSKLQSPNT